MLSGNKSMEIFCNGLWQEFSQLFCWCARLILYALKHHPIPMGSFFFSLMLMATPLVMREEIKKWDTGAIICFAVALLVAYAITFLPPVQAPEHFG